MPKISLCRLDELSVRNRSASVRAARHQFLLEKPLLQPSDGGGKSSVGQGKAAFVSVTPVAAEPGEFVQDAPSIRLSRHVFASFMARIGGRPFRLGEAEDIPPTAAGHIYEIGAEMRLRQPSAFEADMDLAMPRPGLARRRRDKALRIRKGAWKQANSVRCHTQIRE